MHDKKLYVIIGLVILSIACIIAASAIQQSRNKQKQKKLSLIKTRWRPWHTDVSLVAENLLSESLRVNDVFYDHQHRWEPAHDWTAVNAVFAKDKEIWKPHPVRPHIEYTLLYFDEEKGGRVIYRADGQSRTRSQEFIMAAGDVLCMTSGPENEMKVEGNPLLFHFRSKPFAPSSIFQAILDRSKVLKTRQ